MRQRLLGALALGIFALTAGRVQADRPREGVSGGARIEAAGLRLLPGARLDLPAGRGVELRGPAELTLGMGPPESPSVLATFDGAVVRLMDGGGRMLASPQGSQIREEGTSWLRCGPPLQAGVGRSPLETAEPVLFGCPATPLWVSAPAGGLLAEIRVDGQPFVSEGTPFSAVHALGATLVGAGVWGLLGPGALLPLVASPLALVLPLPRPSVLLLLAAACGVGRGRRGWILAVAGLGAAAAAVVVEARESASAAAISVVAPTLFMELFEQKVELAVAANRAAMSGARHPLVIAFGSSSSGGGTPGRFWPQALQEQLPEAQVISLAWGGATTWHLRRIAKELAVQAEVCVVYAGQNDTTAAMPGLSIAQLAAGRPAGAGLVPPVTLEEAAGNLRALKDHCGRLVLMPERVFGREAALAEYAAMLRGVDGAIVVDGGAILRREDMLDDVHPSPVGQQRLADFVAAQVRPLLQPAAP